MAATSCPFCALPAERLVAHSHTALAFRDGFPISKGHTLVVTCRHVASFFETTAEEKSDLFSLLESVKARLDAEYQPDGYNIGINDGAAAGQTVRHLHIHLIPRYKGDQSDPRGGVRWIFPDKADYWTPR
jgi:diadenosine tetraphosphate (Ap4A) HIT family hydrolase